MHCQWPKGLLRLQTQKPKPCQKARQRQKLRRKQVQDEIWTGFMFGQGMFLLCPACFGISNVCFDRVWEHSNQISWVVLDSGWLWFHFAILPFATWVRASSASLDTKLAIAKVYFASSNFRIRHFQTLKSDTPNTVFQLGLKWPIRPPTWH